MLSVSRSVTGSGAVPASVGVRGLPVGGHDAPAGGDLGLGQARQQPVAVERVARAATSTQNDWKLRVPVRGVGDRRAARDVGDRAWVARGELAAPGARSRAAGPAAPGRPRPGGRSSGSCKPTSRYSSGGASTLACRSAAETLIPCSRSRRARAAHSASRW